jgi:hypothetical protein
MELPGLSRSEKLNLQIDGWRPLTFTESRDQSRAQRVVEHRCQQATLNIPCRIEELLGGDERHLDTASVRIDGRQLPSK